VDWQTEGLSDKPNEADRRRHIFLMQSYGDPDRVGPTTSATLAAGRNKPWRRLRFWVAGVLIVLIAVAASLQPTSPWTQWGAGAGIVIVLAIYWAWGAVVAEVEREAAAKSSGVAAPSTTTFQKRRR
jgi:hypothetical protein